METPHTSTQKKSALVKRIDDSTKGTNSKSKLDALLGNHTTACIVAFLFSITLISYVAIICIKETVPDNMTSVFNGMLLLLAGVFGGNQLKK